jgi:hypothetical protein
MGTHESQQRPGEVVEEAMDYMVMMHTIVEGPKRDQHFILNMDQMPVFFSISKKKTLKIIEARTIYVCTSSNDMKHATVAVTTAAVGTVLPSTIIFKGKPDGWIARTEFSTYLPTYHYKCQDNG